MVQMLFVEWRTGLIENRGFQPQYAVSELSEINSGVMFDGDLYEHWQEEIRSCGNLHERVTTNPRKEG
ncbi:hypothetical protein NC651_019184 [Populus alba x Populus x berolinensis]|nr:hypothetical protein NC651_019184 [Populus alba x Populus x berolinensis]